MVRGKRKTLGIFGFVVYADRANVPLASVQELKMIKHRSCTLDTSSFFSKFHVLLLLTHLQVPHPPTSTSSRSLLVKMDKLHNNSPEKCRDFKGERYIHVCRPRWIHLLLKRALWSRLKKSNPLGPSGANSRAKWDSATRKVSPGCFSSISIGLKV